MNEIAEVSRRVLEETEKIIVGKREKIRLIIMAVLANGHVLLDDLPGVGGELLSLCLNIHPAFQDDLQQKAVKGRAGKIVSGSVVKIADAHDMQERFLCHGAGIEVIVGGRRQNEVFMRRHRAWPP